MAHPTKGWDRRKPKSKAARAAVASSCGAARCFLDPKRLKYPVCPTGGSTCGPDCRGVLSAFSRARQQRATAIAKKAVRLGRKLGCAWAKTGKAAVATLGSVGCGCGD